MSAAETSTSGPVRFARFAFPPNRLGYCGPVDGGELARYAAGDVDTGLRHTAAHFDAAYPYLELIAASNGRTDPLDADVVEAYWIGNELVGRVRVDDFGRSIEDRFAKRSGRSWERIGSTVAHGIPNHAYHVLGVMPWAGLVRDGIVDEPLRILDSCRISWGRVLSPLPDGRLVVSRTPLVWSGSGLVPGPPVVEAVDSSVAVTAGDTVAIHWGWVCERLTRRQLHWLRLLTAITIHRMRF